MTSWRLVVVTTPAASTAPTRTAPTRSRRLVLREGGGCGWDRLLLAREPWAGSGQRLRAVSRRRRRARLACCERAAAAEQWQQPSPSPPPPTPLTLEQRVSDLLGGDKRLVSLSDLSRGYCNSVHLATLEGEQGEKQVVVKLYSSLSTLRVPPVLRGIPDQSMATRGLAPRVIHSTDSGIVHEYVEGTTLTEVDMHDPANAPLLRAAAHRLAEFHAVPVEAPFTPEPLVWAWLDAMLASAGTGAQPLPTFITMSELEAEVAFMRGALSSGCDVAQSARTVGAPVVFAHGDCKPSNLMHLSGTLSAKQFSAADLAFIDLELSGPNYRGFDVMKLFRADQGFSEANMRLFLEAYLSAPVAPPCLGSVEQVYAEARMFEPLTWLEAAAFFILVLTTPGRPTAEAERNLALAQQRWERYLQAKSMVDKYQAQASRA